MICPLTLNNQVKGRLLFRLVPQECLKEECAWWDEIYHQCATQTAGVILAASLLALDKVAKELTLIRPK